MSRQKIIDELQRSTEPLTVQEAADKAGCSRMNIYRIIRAGFVQAEKAARFGTDYKVNPQSLAVWMQTRQGRWGNLTGKPRTKRKRD